MPEARLQRAKSTLPLGYQFGDAKRLADTPPSALKMRIVEEYDISFPIAKKDA